MARIKKTARELHQLILDLAPEFIGVIFRVVAEKSANGWTAELMSGTSDFIHLNIRLKTVVDQLVERYELEEPLINPGERGLR